MNNTNHAMSAGLYADGNTNSADKTARVAGILYLLWIATGIFTFFYVPSQIHVHGDAGATVHNLTSHELLFRIGISVNSICNVISLMVPLALYKLLSPVSRSAAVLMVALGVIDIPIGILIVATQLDILSLLNGTIHQHVLVSNQILARVMSLFDESNNMSLATEIYWGLWIVPFGYLVWKSGFLPKVLGFFLMLGCFSYLVYFFAGVFSPNYSVPYFVLLPAMIGEAGTALWLTFVGARNPRLFFGNKSRHQPNRSSRN